MLKRQASIERKTKETDISLALCLDTEGKADIQTGIGFFDHMLTLLAHHGFMDITLRAVGDIEVDAHHTVEDVGIVLGKALAEALGNKEGIRRYGHFMLPMEEALVVCAVDFSGRPYLSFDVPFTTERVGTMETEMFEEFFRAVCLHAGLNLHIKLLDGKNNHHIAEAAFKAFAKAIDMAVTFDKRVKGVLSSKGSLE